MMWFPAFSVPALGFISWLLDQTFTIAYFEPLFYLKPYKIIGMIGLFLVSYYCWILAHFVRKY